MTSLQFAPPALGAVLSLTGLPGGGSKIYDRSPYGNHGTIIGATWKQLPGGFWCLSFDGQDDYVDCGNSLSFDITDALTLKAWANTSTITGDHAIISKGYLDTHSPYYLRVEGNKFNFHCYDTGVKVFTVSSQVISVNTWYLVIATFNKSLSAGNVKIYVNAVEMDVTDYTTSLPTHSGTLRIGKHGSAHPFSGSIALPEIHNRDWGALEVQNCFNREKHLFGVW